MERTLSGKEGQPSERELNKILKRIASGEDWREVFPNVATLEVNTTGTGLNVTIRLSKKEGLPVRLVKEEKAAATVVVKRVNELDFYSLGARDLAKKLGITEPKMRALVEHLRLKKDIDCYKEFKIGKTIYKRYSPKALYTLKKALREVDLNAIWKEYQQKRKRKGNKKYL
jgi:hypothetical protein